MDSELQRFESELERLSPGRLPEGLIARMEAAMEGWEHVPAEVSEEIEKVVPFPKPEDDPERSQDPEVPERGRSSSRSSSSLWAAAASVALLGAVAGVLFSAAPQKDAARKTPVPAEAVALSLANVEFAPQTAKRTILDASNGDLIIANGHRPLYVTRLKYVDRYVFLGKNGEKILVEVPAVNYSVVPVPTD